MVELDGERLFTYYVHEDAFRRRLAAAQSPRLRAELVTV